VTGEGDLRSALHTGELRQIRKEMRMKEANPALKMDKKEPAPKQTSPPSKQPAPKKTAPPPKKKQPAPPKKQYQRKKNQRSTTGEEEDWSKLIPRIVVPVGLNAELRWRSGRANLGGIFNEHLSPFRPEFRRVPYTGYQAIALRETILQRKNQPPFDK
jgi:hypothetical protein